MPVDITSLLKLLEQILKINPVDLGHSCSLFFDTEIGAQFCSISQFISVTKCCKCYIFCCACFSDMDISSLSQIIAS